MLRQSGIATLAAIAIILGAFGVGAVFEHFVEAKDHPVEQAAEDVLDDYGIDYDFSKDKKADDKH